MAEMDPDMIQRLSAYRRPWKIGPFVLAGFLGVATGTIVMGIVHSKRRVLIFAFNPPALTGLFVGRLLEGSSRAAVACSQAADIRRSMEIQRSGDRFEMNRNRVLLFIYSIEYY